MADISTYLAAILSSQYGRDMREPVINAIEAINTTGTGFTASSTIGNLSAVASRLSAITTEVRELRETSDIYHEMINEHEHRISYLEGRYNQLQQRCNSTQTSINNYKSDSVTYSSGSSSGGNSGTGFNDGGSDNTGGNSGTGGDSGGQQQETQTYTVTYLDSDGSTIQIFTNLTSGTATPTISTSNMHDSNNHPFLAWYPTVASTVTANATYTATYDTSSGGNSGEQQETQYYTITYVDSDGTVLQTFTNVAEGSATPSIDTSNLKDENDYPFAAWSPSVASTVTGNATYTATYESGAAEESYTITYKDSDNTTVLWTYVGRFIGDATPVPDTSNLQDSNGNTFKEWSPTPSATVTGNATYTAVYNSDASPPQQATYTVRYLDADQNAVATYTNLASGSSTPTYSGSGLTNSQNESFLRWWPLVSSTVTGDVDYQAQFNGFSWNTQNYNQLLDNESNVTVAQFAGGDSLVRGGTGKAIAMYIKVDGNNINEVILLSTDSSAVQTTPSGTVTSHVIDQITWYMNVYVFGGEPEYPTVCRCSIDQDTSIPYIDVYGKQGFAERVVETVVYTFYN